MSVENINFEKTPSKAALEEIKRNLPIIMESLEIQAKVKKGYYDYLIKEGFTEQQALEIAKAY